MDLVEKPLKSFIAILIVGLQIDIPDPWIVRQDLGAQIQGIGLGPTDRQNEDKADGDDHSHTILLVGWIRVMESEEPAIGNNTRPIRVGTNR